QLSLVTAGASEVARYRCAAAAPEIDTATAAASNPVLVIMPGGWVASATRPIREIADPRPPAGRPFAAPLLGGRRSGTDGRHRAMVSSRRRFLVAVRVRDLPADFPGRMGHGV